MEEPFIAIASVQSWEGLEFHQDVVTTIYIGKPRNFDSRFNHVEHALTNPYDFFTIGERAKTLEKYKQWLWKQMQDPKSPEYQAMRRIVILAEEGPIVLVCTCYPQECCASIVKSAVEWWIKEEAGDDV